jgi:gluconokinase
MAPLPKLVWFAEQEPKLFERVAHWVGIKDYVLLRLCEALVVDHSVASSNGLLDIHQLVWDDEALGIAGITEEQLPELVPTTTVLPGLTPAAAAATGLGHRWGRPAANLGLGAVKPGVVACSIGTSGAMRVMVEKPGVDPLGGVYCYALTDERWVVGGAISNGGIVLDWAGAALAPDLGEHPEEELLALAGRAPVGSGGLIMLPYLLVSGARTERAAPRRVRRADPRTPNTWSGALEGVPAAP